MSTSEPPDADATFAALSVEAILQDSVFSLEVFAQASAVPGIEDDPAGILLQRVKRATLDSETPGTVASINTASDRARRAGDDGTLRLLLVAAILRQRS